MTECIAATCDRELRDHETAARQLLCDPCLHSMRGWLASIPNQMIVLREGSMQREVSGGTGRSGTKTAPLPGRLDTINLLGPWAAQPVPGNRDDQDDTPTIAEVLYGWVRVIQEERRTDGPLAVTEEALAGWLAAQLGYAVQQPWAGEMRHELHGVMVSIWRITATAPRTHAISRPCPRCDHMTLSRTDHDLYTRCSTCGTSYTTQELGDDAIRRSAAA
ncbi:hypothetical protein ACWGHD_04405 [Streptomyces xanthophaeus]